MEQYFPAPAPSKTEFNTLNTQVQGLADQMAKKYSATGTTSFAALDSNSYASKALDNIHSNIANLSTGIHKVESGGGPYYFAVLGKHTNDYYGGYLFSYATNETSLSYRFSYQNGTFVIYKVMQ